VHRMYVDSTCEQSGCVRLLKRRSLRVLFRWCSAVLASFTLPTALFAQATLAEPTSRSESFSILQAEKAKVARPPGPDKAEALVRKMEAVFLVDPSGFFPYFDSVYQGGGLTGGAGYRKFYGDNTFWEVKGLYSVLNYKLFEAATVSKDRLNGRLMLGTRFGWRDATQVEYFGVGQNSKEEDMARFRFQQTYVEGRAEYRPLRWLPIKSSLAFENWNTLQGQGSDPSIETIYTPATAPGLGADPSYVHTNVSAGIDWRQSPGYTRRGGLYEARFHDYRNTNGGLYSFQKLEGEVIQHVPLLRETWVLAARGRVETTLNDNAVIPYFMLPSLGSGSTLRGFSSYRFRDRHSLLMNAEFRWMPSAGLDMALFYDAGKVTSRRGDLDFKGLKSDVGIGARFHGPLATPLRIDLAVGNEGWRIVFSGGPVF
jgi:hypothetical protein